MKEGQDADLLHHRRHVARPRKNSPHLEMFRKKGVEVLLLSDRVDEWVVSHLHRVRRQAAGVGREGRARPRQARGRGREKKAAGESRTSSRTCSSSMKTCLGERGEGVRVTHRLTDSPACLVADEHGMSTNLERLLKAAGQKAPAAKPILEINRRHPLVQRLKDEGDGPPLRGLESHPVRSGAARRGRPARGSGRVRQAAERADAGACG